jgi:Ser/Thr protein kinase RdoA (MazF antagonist)
MYPSASIAALCRRWCAAAPVSIAPLGTPGFSGSQVFVVELSDRPGRFVLKSFHAGASVDHARFVHGLVRHLRAECSTSVAEVMPALDGDTIASDAEGRLWELARFMPGVAVPCPTPAQVAAATTTLARLHLAAAGLPDHPPRAGISPGIERRIDHARRLLAQPWQARRAVWSRAARDWMPVEVVAALDDRVVAAIAIFNQCGGERLLTRVAAMGSRSCLLQPVLRDVWCDHVLFADEQSDSVTAIVDLHAAGIDTPATDLTRLMGSWAAPAGGERLSILDRWPTAVAAYDRVRSLSREEAERIPFLHATGVVLGLDNWFRWTLEEHRVFPDARRMLDRIDRLLIEMPGAITTAWSAAGNVD